MDIIRDIMGPKSKYDETIPYTYEARVPIIDSQDEFNSYIADTICGLIEQLIRNDITPDDTEIYEIFREEEKLIDKKLFTANGNWLKKPELCVSFKEHYEGHISDHGCSFEDRD